jgi:hypothetical protein
MATGIKKGIASIVCGSWQPAVLLLLRKSESLSVWAYGYTIDSYESTLLTIQIIVVYTHARFLYHCTSSYHAIQVRRRAAK